MCCTTLPIATTINKQDSKVHKRRQRMLREAKERKIRLMNRKLYLKNKSIIEENEKLRKRAFRLHQENQALLSQLLNKLCTSSPSPLPVIDSTNHH